jgi:hypothetical protein
MTWAHMVNHHYIQVPLLIFTSTKNIILIRLCHFKISQQRPKAAGT